MKTKNIIILFAGLIGMSFLFSACNSEPKIKVPEEIEESLHNKYNDYSISKVEWDLVENFFVGAYRRSKTGKSNYCKSWFDTNGKWLMTEIMELVYDIDIPKTVVENFEQSGYAKNNVVEICEVEFSDGIVSRYVIKTRTNSFLYRTNGELLKEIIGMWENRPIVIAVEILEFIKNNYDDSSIIVDADMKSTPLSVRIYEERYKTICFDSPTLWLATYWRISSSEKIPDAVIKTLAGKEPSERYYIEYHVPQESVLQNINTRNNEENKKIIYAFKFSNATDTTLFIEENGDEIEITDISL